MRSADESFDVVVVGGGPAGSTAATVVAMRGHRVLLVEAQRFPRYQIGESLLPSTVHGICGLLGVSDEVAGAGFTTKRGGTFRWGRSRDPWQFSFASSTRVPEPMSTAFQVERSRFDHILLRNAAEHGVTVREGCRAGRVTRDGTGRVDGVDYTDPAGTTHTVSARYVIDASGNTSRLHGQVGPRVRSEFFRNVAVFGYFAGGDRLPAPHSGNIFCTTFDAGWFWYIPLRDDLTSVGAVVSPRHSALVRQDPRAAWTELIAACPDVAEKVAGVPTATLAPYDQVRVRQDYSYWHRSFWTPGLLLVGDAACFVDPVLSSGVHLATYGALLAARSVNAGLDGLPDERGCREFETRYQREYSLFYQFLVSFYDLQRDERSYFWSAKRLTGVDADETAAFAELVGGVASGDAGVVTPSDVRAGWSGAAADLDGAVAALATGDDGFNPLFSSPLVGRTFQAGKDLQDEARYGVAPDGGTDPGGLTVAPDGLGWAER